MTRSGFFLAIAFVAISGVARAEIACMGVLGCFETGKRIRLMDNPSRGVDTTRPTRKNVHVRRKAPDEYADYRLVSKVKHKEIAAEVEQGD
jgi:hypothetical protein